MQYSHMILIVHMYSELLLRLDLTSCQKSGLPDCSFNFVIFEMGIFVSLFFYFSEAIFFVALCCVLLVLFGDTLAFSL